MQVAELSLFLELLRSSVFPYYTHLPMPLRAVGYRAGMISPVDLFLEIYGQTPEYQGLAKALSKRL